VRQRAWLHASFTSCLFSSRFLSGAVAWTRRTRRSALVPGSFDRVFFYIKLDLPAIGVLSSSFDRASCDREVEFLLVQSPLAMAKKKQLKQKQMENSGEVAQLPADVHPPTTSNQESQPAGTSVQDAHPNGPTQATNTKASPPDNPLPGISTLMISKPKPKPAKINIVEAWDDYFGEGTLDDWARFCRDLGLEGDFSSKTKCKKVCLHILLCPSPSPSLGYICTDCPGWSVQAMKDVWINIWDFLRTPNKEEVTRFPSEAALSAYTMKKRSRTYPRNKIRKDSPLKLLMANILYPRYGRRKKGKA
jgi:hypothetical protein